MEVYEMILSKIRLIQSLVNANLIAIVEIRFQLGSYLLGTIDSGL